MKAARRWLRVGRLSMLPIGPLRHYVECVSCQSTYAPEVLTAAAATAGPSEDVLTTVLRQVVVALLRTGDLPVAVARHRKAVIVLQRYANRPYGARDLDDDLRELAGVDLEERLDALSPRLNDLGRSAVLAACAQLAPVSAREEPAYREVALEVARSLAIPTALMRRELDLRAVRAAVS